MKTNKIRVALLCDSPDEGWYSMDLVASMLHSNLRANHPEIEVTSIALPIRRIFSRLPYCQSRGFSADRLFHRFADYPSWISARKARFDVFHVIDHSYSQLVRYLPPNRTVVTCHDLDAFSSVLQPPREERTHMFRLMTRSILNGLRRAQSIVCCTETVRSQLIAEKLVPQERTDVVPLGVHPAYSPVANQQADDRARRLLKSGSSATFDILHVGSTIPRKRIDVLLKLMHRLRRHFPSIRLLRVGGAFTHDQQHLLNELSLNDCTFVLPYLDQDTLSAVYRQADMVLITSDGEGFGLPVLEGLACGKPVIATDLPVLREVGGSGPVAYCLPGDLDHWEATLVPLIQKYLVRPDWRAQISRRSIERASQFSWEQYTNRMSNIYSSLFIGQIV